MSSTSAAPPQAVLSLSEKEAEAVRGYVESNSDGTYKIIRATIIGMYGAGANSFRQKIVEGPEDVYDPTTEVLSRWTTTVYGKAVTSDYMDVPAYEDELESIVTKTPRTFIHDMDACFLVYSTTSRKSMEWIQAMFASVGDAIRESVPSLFVVASNTDIDEDQWEVSLEEGERFSRKIGGMFLKVSTRTGFGLQPDDLVAITSRILLGQINSARAAASKLPVPGPDDTIIHKVKRPSWICRIIRRIFSRAR